MLNTTIKTLFKFSPVVIKILSNFVQLLPLIHALSKPEPFKLIHTVNSPKKVGSKNNNYFVRCFTEAEKDTVVAYYVAGHTILATAKEFGKSPRTIGKVLDERGLSPHTDLKIRRNYAIK